jgi:ABC-type multidrug transport system fused ATPase/permease subunit
MINYLKNLDIFFESTKDRKKQISIAQFAFLISSIFELGGIFLLGPLIFIATSGSGSLGNEYVLMVYNLLGTKDFDVFFIIVVMTTGLIILLGGFISAFSVILLSKIATQSGVILGNKLFRHYIFQKWPFYLETSKNKMINEIYQETSRVTQNFLVPLLMINKSIITTSFIIIGLLFVDIKLTAAFFLFLSIIYILMYLLFRQRLYKNSELLTAAHEERLDFLNDVFASMKQIKIWGNENYFLSGFHVASQKWGSIYRQNLNIALLPRYLVETCILVGAVFFIYLNFSSEINVSETIPKLSIFLFSAFKLLPSLQALYLSSSTIRGNIYSLENIINILYSSSENIEGTEHRETYNQINKIQFEDISFSYKGATSPAINNISICLEIGTIIGITGHSGAGKSTFLDILMGLQEQSTGLINVNDRSSKLFDNSDWFKKISYAPPSTALFKANLEMNILFNAENASLEEAFKVANLDFLNLSSDLLKPYTQDNFSEGQLQRIGLARAIAKVDSDLIILDEPTSALDNINKKLFIDNLRKYKADKLIILVTHDLELLKGVDKIAIFKDGKIEEYPDFETAILQSDELARLQDA